MGQLLLVFACLGLGALLRRVGRLPADAPVALNAFVTNLALPALTLLGAHDVLRGERPGAEAAAAVAMAWLLFFAALGLFAALGRRAGWPRETTGALVLTAGLSNTSFVGYPLLEALYGPEALRVGVLNDQPGSFLVVSTVGLLTAAAFSPAARTFSPRATLARLAAFPPLWAFVLAIATRPFDYPPALALPLERLAATLVPVALVSVGCQLRFDPVVLREARAPLVLGLVFKLALAPALLAVLFVFVLKLRGFVIRVTLVEAAMAPMVTGALVAAEYGLDRRLANLMLAVGIPLSLATVPLWAWLLRGV